MLGNDAKRVGMVEGWTSAVIVKANDDAQDLPKRKKKTNSFLVWREYITAYEPKGDVVPEEVPEVVGRKWLCQFKGYQGCLSITVIHLNLSFTYVLWRPFRLYGIVS